MSTPRWSSEGRECTGILTVCYAGLPALTSPAGFLPRSTKDSDRGSGTRVGWGRPTRAPGITQPRSKRSSVMTLSHAATKSRTNFSSASDEA